MIETYKIVCGKYDNEITPTLAMLDTTQLKTTTYIHIILLTGLVTISH